MNRDRTHDGRSLRILTLIDEYSRACLALKAAQIAIGLGQTTDNRVRPHSSLGYRPPAPVSYPDLAFRLPMAAAMQ